MEFDKRKIKVCMALNGLTTKALAEKMGMQANNLSTVLTRGTCRPETAARIAEGLGVSVAEIMKEE
ncbi:MAG: helix-turn-helix transcriptional regulator [Ruminococcaceae bacterium]|nr:helix-turn-helix transcriptional regulator [Oscillospiraceae bacterium]MBE6984888.1 helix-turn-helix transcriptional regulator [Oscillospiraceae bacterium]